MHYYRVFLPDLNLAFKTYSDTVMPVPKKFELIFNDFRCSKVKTTKLIDKPFDPITFDISPKNFSLLTNVKLGDTINLVIIYKSFKLKPLGFNTKGYFYSFYRFNTYETCPITLKYFIETCNKIDNIDEYSKIKL